MSSGKLRPFVVGMGGTLKPGSSTEGAVKSVLELLRQRGAESQFFGGADLDLPSYNPAAAHRDSKAQALVEALRKADAVVLASPGYHGGISGLIKNALDYTEDMSRDARPYLEGRPVACIATGAGWQGAATTLAALRSVVHALRGWPTPLGVMINTQTALSDQEDKARAEAVTQQFHVLAGQLMSFNHSAVLT